MTVCQSAPSHFPNKFWGITDGTLQNTWRQFGTKRVLKYPLQFKFIFPGINQIKQNLIWIASHGKRYAIIHVDTNKFCHRLARKEDAGIILRFRDLSRRNEWLFGAKNLKGHSDAISISPDVPPVLRAVKKDLPQKRKDLSPVDRKTAHIRYLRQWPYMELVVGKNRKIRSDIKKVSVVENILGFNALYSPQENM